MRIEQKYHHTWSGIKRRCFNPKSEHYANYGGRGITMYKPWISDYMLFEEYIDTFLGKKPNETYSLDRIDNNGNYVPGNLRWADKVTQVRNRRNTKLTEFLAVSLRKFFKIYPEIPFHTFAKAIGLKTGVICNCVNNITWKKIKSKFLDSEVDLQILEWKQLYDQYRLNSKDAQSNSCKERYEKDGETGKRITRLKLLIGKANKTLDTGLTTSKWGKRPLTESKRAELLLKLEAWKEELGAIQSNPEQS